MKKIIVASAIIVSNTVVFAQYPSLYLLVKSITPRGWKVGQEDNKIILAKRDSVWFYSPVSAFENSAPVQQLKKGQFKIEIEYGKQWSDEKMKQAKFRNDSIEKEIQYLKEEKFSKEKMLEEREKLLSNKITLPDINSDDFSIFIFENPDESDKKIWPEENSVAVKKEEENFVMRFYDCFEETDITDEDF